MTHHRRGAALVMAIVAIALAGMAEREILCDNSIRVLTLLASVDSTTTRDCAEPTTFSSVSSENRPKSKVPRNRA